MRYRLFSLLFAAVAILACGSIASAAIHPGDELAITVYYHPELTGPLTVDSTGSISMPLIGMVDVRGLDTHAVATKIQSSLRAYVVKPAVNVQLKSQLSLLFISGGPGGTQKFEPGETLVAALGALTPRLRDPSKDAANAGGQNQFASFLDLERSAIDVRRIGVIRDGRRIGTFDAIDLFSHGTGGPVLEAGDTIALANKPIMVKVTGEVARPGYAFLTADEPLADALSQVGGLLPTATTSRVELHGATRAERVALGESRWNSPAADVQSIVVPSALRVTIVGLVEKPGPVELKTDISLLTALYEAGGPTKWADLGNVQVLENNARTRYDIARLIHGDTSQNPTLRDGDVIFVPEGRKISPDSLIQGLLNASLLFRLR